MCAHTLKLYFENLSTKLMNKRTTIKDIAAQAGVSTGTVDRVIHDRGRVSVDVKEKVLQVMQDLNFEPNLIASTLAFNRILTMGVLMPVFLN